MPSTSAGVRPASSSASSTASAASRSSLRPEFLEKSVAPMPAMAARPVRVPEDIYFAPIVRVAVAANYFHGHQVTLDRGHLAGERHGVVGVPGHTEPQTDRFDHRARSGPV